MPGHLREQEQRMEEWASKHGVDVTDSKPNLIKSIGTLTKKEPLSNDTQSEIQQETEKTDNLSLPIDSEEQSKNKQFNIKDKKHQ